MKQSDFIKQQKKKYKELNPCYCPSLNETVYFTSDGLHHLLYNDRRPRISKERYYRATMIDHVEEVIKNSKQAIRKDIVNTNTTVWSLDHLIDNADRDQIIRVILKKDGKGRLKFLSAMRTIYIGNKKPQN